MNDGITVDKVSELFFVSDGVDKFDFISVDWVCASCSLSLAIGDGVFEDNSIFMIDFRVFLIETPTTNNTKPTKHTAKDPIRPLLF